MKFDFDYYGLCKYCQRCRVLARFRNGFACKDCIKEKLNEKM